MCIVAALGAGIATSGALMRSTVPAWKNDLSVALKRGSRSPTTKYLQLGTVTTEGRPAVRTVVFRGFLWDTCSITFITDARSSKIEEMMQNPHCEICWYFEKAREQFRIGGELTMVTSQENNKKLQRAREVAWNNLSDGGRESFVWPHPGLPLGQGAIREGMEAQATTIAATSVDQTTSSVDPSANNDTPEGLVGETVAADPPAEHFVLIVMEPKDVDQLRLSSPQHRWKHYLQEDGEWQVEEVNP